MAEPYKHIYKVDLNQPLKRFDVGEILAKGNEKANRFEVNVYRDGIEVALAGYTVSGYFTKPDEETIRVKGTAAGNVACVEPSKSCYAYDGAFSLAINIEGDGFTGTVAVFDGLIVRTTTDNIVDGDRVIYGLEDLLAQIAATEAAANNANTAAANANTSANNADTAAANANKWANAEANAASLSAESKPTVDVTEKDGKKVLSFGIPAGKTPNITFRVATGEPGTQVQIAKSGTAENPIIDLTIPRGDTGAVEGIDYYAGSPAALGTAMPGTANGVARGDHVHPMPSAADVGARPSTWMPTAADVGARPSTWMPTAADVGARPNTWTPSAADVGALAANGTAADSAMLGGKPPEYYTSSASEVVWENASPTSEFAAQTVSLDLSDAKHIEIVTDERSNYDTYFCITRIPVDGNKYTIQSLGNMGTAFRFVTATATGVVFGEGNTATPTPSDSGWAYGTLNYLVVPMKITKIV